VRPRIFVLSLWLALSRRLRFGSNLERPVHSGIFRQARVSHGEDINKGCQELKDAVARATLPGASPTLTLTLQIARPPASPKMMHRNGSEDMDTTQHIGSHRVATLRLRLASTNIRTLWSLSSPASATPRLAPNMLCDGLLLGNPPCICRSQQEEANWCLDSSNIV
jgi:hypothetical protein